VSSSSSTAPATAASSSARPQLSVVIPVYNEEPIVEAALRRYHAELSALGRPFEMIVAANGCRDSTVPIVLELATGLPGLVVLESPDPDYGRALRQGILAARGDIVVCDEIDLCDIGFVKRALRRLDHDECDFVVGSKAMVGARDRRPLTRRAATRVINGLLWATLGFQGTDTHGLKAFLRAAVLPVVDACVVDKDLFASELVIRAGRAGLRMQEIPIELEEQRSPPIHLVKRVPRVLRDLGRLVVAVRLDRGGRRARKASSGPIDDMPS
jgi:cellulose synthase/poly-beta-1,6-N-acetylglucosamine synthase-like glycosyltransferase